MADTPSFWDTLKNGAINTVTNIAKPLGGSLGTAISNVETFAQSKVGQAGQAIVQATPGNPTNTPVQTTPSIPDAQAKAATRATLIGLALALAFLWFLIRKKG